MSLAYTRVCIHIYSIFILVILKIDVLQKGMLKTNPVESQPCIPCNAANVMFIFSIRSQLTEMIPLSVIL